jgi:hypothetical protein
VEGDWSTGGALPRRRALTANAIGDDEQPPSGGRAVTPTLVTPNPG